MIITREFNIDSSYDIASARKSSHFLGAHVQLAETGEIVAVYLDTGAFRPKFYYDEHHERQIYSWQIHKVILSFELEGGFDTCDYKEFDQPVGIDYLKNLEEGYYLVKFIRPRNMEDSVEILRKFGQASSIGGCFLFDLKDILITCITRIHP